MYRLCHYHNEREAEAIMSGVDPPGQVRAQNSCWQTIGIKLASETHGKAQSRGDATDHGEIFQCVLQLREVTSRRNLFE